MTDQSPTSTAGTAAQVALETILRCPLCGSDDATALESYPYKRIWTELREVHGAAFSDDVLAAHTPAPATTLSECRACGLQYFAPSRPGNASFYHELIPHVPYLHTRWEFEVVAQRLRAARSVIDLGSGHGAFLRIVRRTAPEARIVGVDHNRDAIARLRRDGIEAHAADVTDIADAEPGSFDAVCVFQTLEHVGEPRSLVATASRLLTPGGRLFLSVPNRERTVRMAREPLDFPPHHVTRWSARQFSYLADELQLRLASVSYEPPPRWGMREPQRRRAEAHFARYGPRVLAVASKVNDKIQTPALWYEIQVRRGAYVRRGLFGHTLLVELRRAP